MFWGGVADKTDKKISLFHTASGSSTCQPGNIEVHQQGHVGRVPRFRGGMQLILYFYRAV